MGDFVGPRSSSPSRGSLLQEVQEGVGVWCFLQLQWQAGAYVLLQGANWLMPPEKAYPASSGGPATPVLWWPFVITESSRRFTITTLGLCLCVPLLVAG